MGYFESDDWIEKETWSKSTKRE